MNYWLRTIGTAATIKLDREKVTLFEDGVTHHRVWPTDLDIMMHMNNGRYFTATDITRFLMLYRAGMWDELMKRKQTVVIAGETIQFRKELNPFQKYQIVTRTIGWDDKFFYVQHRFVRGEDVHAVSMVKLRVVGPGERSPATVLRYIYDDVEETNMTDVISNWNASSDEQWQQANVG